MGRSYSLRTGSRVAALLLIASMVLAGCAPPDAGSTSEGDTRRADAEQAEPIRAEPVPEAIALIDPGYTFVRPGYLTVGNHPNQLPLSDYSGDGRSVIGSEPDIARLVADSLGLELDVIPVAWADWPLGLESGRFDAVLSNVTVTEERKLKYDFSSYRNDLLGIYVRADSPIAEVSGREDVAGLRIVVGASTNQDQILRRWDAANIADGLAPVEYQYYDDFALGRLAVLSGRADANFTPNATSSYLDHDGQTRLVGLFPGGWPETAYISVTTRKGSGLVDAVTAALNAQIDNGNYRRVLERWGLEDEAIERSESNPPGLAAG